MLYIIRKSEDQFLVNVNDVSTAPLNVKELFQVMLELEVEVDEIEFALSELLFNDHKFAEFGVNRTCICTK